MTAATIRVAGPQAHASPKQKARQNRARMASAEGNRFARRVDELDADERELAEPAMAAARNAFQGLSEADTDSHYYCAPGLTPEQTYVRVAEEAGRVMALCVIEGERDNKLGVDDIELIHRGIFLPVFGEKALRFRRTEDVLDEAVQYPVMKGTREAPELRPQSGSGGRQLRANLTRALKQFEQKLEEVAEMDEPAVRDAALPVVALYAKTISIHPFIDGNGRTAMAIQSYALQRAGLLHVAVPVTEDTRWALGCALRNDRRHDYAPLADIVVEAISGAQA